MTERLRDSVAVDITAAPEHVYALVADIPRMGEWSPECRHCAWTAGATGPAVGARFKARNKGRRGPSWFNSPVVTVAEPGREFAFNRKGRALAPTPGATGSNRHRREREWSSPTTSSNRCRRP